MLQSAFDAAYAGLPLPSSNTPLKMLPLRMPPQIERSFAPRRQPSMTPRNLEDDFSKKKDCREKMLKQQSCTPAMYPPRSSIGKDATNWDDPEYKPTMYESAIFSNPDDLPVWADKTTCSVEEIGGRLTYCGDDADGSTVQEVCSFDKTLQKFRNPKGKTGIFGRGTLGRFGPNHAADCIVTREHPTTKKLQVILVQKVAGDKADMAFPAGMVEFGEDVPETLKRELKEEALADNVAVERLFAECRRGVVYRGHVDDFRNTDHAWMETTAVHFHATADVGCDIEFSIKDTDEIKKAGWVDIDSVQEMYASHYDWLCIVRDALKALPKAIADKAGDAAITLGALSAAEQQWVVTTKDKLVALINDAPSDEAKLQLIAFIQEKCDASGKLDARGEESGVKRQRDC